MAKRKVKAPTMLRKRKMEDEEGDEDEQIT